MDDEHLTAQSVVDEFRQALADCQFALAKSNALVKIRDRRIAELTRQLEAARGPSGPTPGPPPAR